MAVVRLDQDARGRYRVRVSCGPGRRWRIVLGALGRPAAERRAALVAELSHHLRHRHDALALLEEAASHATSEAALLDAIARAKKSAARPDRQVETFRTVAERWASGELAKRHPDHIRARKSSPWGMVQVLCEKVGDVPIARFTLADADAALAALPKDLTSATRSRYARIITLVMRIAVYPLKLRDADPIPKGWAPSDRSSIVFPWLYPDEDLRLMQCEAVPLHRRCLWGLLAREGLRMSEALRLTRDCIDLERGAIRLDENKTEEPRAWALSEGVADALAVVWPRYDGPDRHTAETFRADLQTAGIDRPELFLRKGNRRPIRAHDLRASFVTLALANGRSEAYVTDRTGHHSSGMLRRYQRAARHAGELGLGDWTPLDVALGLRKTGPRSGPPEGPKTASSGGNRKGKSTTSPTERRSGAVDGCGGPIS